MLPHARRVCALVTILTGAFVAALTLSTTTSRNHAPMLGGYRLDVFFDSAASAAALGAIVAVLVSVKSRNNRTAFIASGIGIAVLAVATLVHSPVQLHLRGLAAGLILGGSAALAVGPARRLLQCALVVGVMSAFVMLGPLEHVPYRYRDYMASSPRTYLLVLLGVLALLLVASVWASVFDNASEPARGSARALVVGAAVPVAGLVLYWLFVRSVSSLGSNGAMGSRWLLGLAVVPLLVGAAFALRAATGAVVLAALAYAAVVSTGSVSSASSGTVAAVVFSAMLVAGTVIGCRWPVPLVGFALLAVVAAAGLFTNGIESTAHLLLLPFAVGLVFASLLPTDVPAATISVTTPIVVSVPIVAQFGWTAYTPLTTVEPTRWPSGWEWTSTATAILSVAAAAGALVLLRRRDAGLRQ
ncbi:hypothetical protein [Rhodococcoides yunnanense]|uniref:hypothetical protein n=1 Tax=Rhodococcoides yunnanense TaxID=278209 RepID=UPI000933FF4A|nr:hypothetical protein [Rhodococcus yunnanensis]